MAKTAKKRANGAKRRPGRPAVDSIQLTPRLHPAELKHLDTVIQQHFKRTGADEPMHRHEALRRLAGKATVDLIS